MSDPLSPPPVGWDYRHALGFQGYTALLGLCGFGDGIQGFVCTTQTLHQGTSLKFTFAKAFGKSLEMCAIYQLLFLSVEEGQTLGCYLLSAPLFSSCKPKTVGSGGGGVVGSDRGWGERRCEAESKLI